MIGIDLVVEEARFPPRWYRPWRKKVWAIEVLGHGHTQALRKKDVCYMARDLMACMYDNCPDDYIVRSIDWIP